LKDFSEELDFGKKQNAPKKSKGTLFYIQMVISSLFWIQLLLLVGIIGATGYIYVQNKSEYVNTNFLDPICPLIL